MLDDKTFHLILQKYLCILIEIMHVFQCKDYFLENVYFASCMFFEHPRVDCLGGLCRVRPSIRPLSQAKQAHCNPPGGHRA